jgi:transposase
MDMRELKGLEIAARCRIEYKDGAWLVPSQSGNGKYRVTLGSDGARCECEDFQLRLQECKHVHAAKLARQRDHGGAAPQMDTDTVPTRPTYKQDWPKYAQARATEKRRVLALLADLCRGIPEPARPPQQRGRKPHLLRDAVFCMGLKVYGTLSGERSSCDLIDAHERGHITKPIPGAKVSAFFENAELATILQGLVRTSALPLATVESTFAPDSTGFSTSRFIRWFDEKYGVERSGHAYVKAHAICGVKTHVVTSIEIAGPTAGDSPMFRPLLEATAEHFKVERVCADKAYLSRENLDLVASLGGTAYVPFKSNSVEGEAGSLWQQMFHYYNFRRQEFLNFYHARSNIESAFSMLKAKFRDHVRSRTDVAMKNETLTKFLMHNLCVVHQSHVELGIEPVFWQDESKGEAPAILPLVRPS